MSNAFNAPHRVKVETLQRVQAVIDGLGYKPNQSARSLKTGLRYTFGYMAPDDDPFDPNPLMGGFLTALCDAAAEAGYRILLFRPTHDARRAIDDLVAARQVDGIILSDIVRDDVRVERLTELGLPFVTFGKTGAGKPQRWVDVDNTSSMENVAGFLAQSGHRRVGYIASSSSLPWLQERNDGFLRGAARDGLSVATVYESPVASDNNESLIRSLRGMLRAPKPPTVLVAANDMLALAAYEAVREEGLAIGGDIAVIGYNDLPLCQLLVPKLTSVRIPLPRIAREAVDLLLRQLKGDAEPSAGTLLPAELVVRESFLPRQPPHPI